MAALYVASYSADSCLGGYWLKPERDGKHRWRTGLPMPTAILWQPAFGYAALYRCDFLGALYKPLVAFDRRWFHPTMYVTDHSTFTWVNSEARPTDIHPSFRDEFIRSR